jgi:hypothetical protein
MSQAVASCRAVPQLFHAKFQRQLREATNPLTQDVARLGCRLKITVEAMTCLRYASAAFGSIDSTFAAAPPADCVAAASSWRFACARSIATCNSSSVRSGSPLRSRSRRRSSASSSLNSRGASAHFC